MHAKGGGGHGLTKCTLQQYNEQGGPECDGCEHACERVGLVHHLGGL